MKKVEELIRSQGGNYILPFLWMHGESKEILKEEIDHIAECGIREICLESRPYPDYCGKRWWDDVDYIMKEARERNMRIWILDDDKFPTGHANGAFKNKYPELAKVYLAERHMDIIGPIKEGAVLISPFLGKDGKLIAVLACQKPDTETLAVSKEDMINLTEQVHEGFVYFQLPKGRYRLFVLFTTQQRGGREDYMNLIDSRSVKVLIHEVYEKHYKHYKDYFGNTLAGFFSDEPEIGNTSGYDFHELLGKRDVKLPWSEELLVELQEIWKDELVYHLPALWYEMGEKTSRIRSQYMDAVTKLVGKCFSQQLGDWCEQHGVEYIGHIIEDDNAHSRLGCSIGHYYREMKGQHMSGIDVVHHQIVPGFDDKIHQWIAGDSDGEFFHYGLAKMGSSCAHIDPKKNGRALCEVFGNYGWAEGVSLMKWLTDHMLVRGINEFVPHAFSPKYPDTDCPPHFYARGNNPQFKFFAQLMKYMNRISHLISGGIHISDAAILYHGEAEWSSKKVMLFQKPVRKLLEDQLDCDVIPPDIFLENYVSIKNKKLFINQEEYGCLIIPYCEVIPKTAVDFVIKSTTKGLQVYVINGLPQKDTFGNLLPEEFKAAVSVIRLKDLAKTIRHNQTTQISCSKQHKSLRFYCYQQEDGKVYLFFNENPYEAIDINITIDVGEYSAMEEYDARVNESVTYRMNQNKFQLKLEPGQLRIMLPSKKNIKAGKLLKCIMTQKLDCDWRVSLKAAGSEGNFEEKLLLKAGENLPNMNGAQYFNDFSGTYRYEGCLELGEQSFEQCMLYLPKFGDCAEVFINKKEVGSLLGSPDRIDVTKFIQKGNNQLIIEVTNTLVWRLKDGASTHLQVHATGMTMSPVLEYYR